MPFDDVLKRTLDSLARDLAAAAQAARDEAAQETHTAAEAAMAAAVASAQAESERSAATAREEGLAEGHRQGYEAGKAEGFQAGRSEGFHAGRTEGFQAGRTEGFQAGRTEGFQAGRTEGVQAGRTQGFEAGKAEGHKAGRAEGYEAGKADRASDTGAVDLPAIERLTAAMRAVDRAHSLKEILDTLARCAALEAQRAAVLLVRGTQLQGWRLIGFGPALDEKTGFETPLAESGIVGEAVRTDTPVARDGSEGGAPRFAAAPSGSDLIAVPIAVGGQVVAVLYADRAAGGDGQSARQAWRPVLEIMARHAGRALEAVTAFRTAQIVSQGMRGKSAAQS
jgi:flagellar biosynthesis/type III secretory pathway protein FliH